MEGVEVPVKEGRRLLVNTAMSIGYSEPLAEQLVDSALWLDRHRRTGAAVDMLMVYMLLTADFPFEQRKPARDEQYGLRSLCPVMAANVCVQRFQSIGPPDGVLGIMGPAAPALMAPTLVAYGMTVGRAIRLHAYNITIRYAKNGFEIEGDSFGGYPLVDDDCNRPTGIEFIEPFDLPAAGELTSIHLPEVRMTGGDTLRLHD